MKRQIACLGTLVPALLASDAEAAVMDFNGLTIYPSNVSATVSAPYIEDGFKLSTLAGVSFNMGGGTIYSVQPAHPYWAGTPSVYSGVISGYGSAFSLEKQDGGVFDLISIDAAAFQNHPNALAFNVYGYPASGGSVYQSFTLDTSFTTLQTLTFNTSFKNLNKILFSSVYAQVDNINLSVPSTIAPTTVPLPAAAWSMLLGLAGLAFGSTRRYKSQSF